MLVHPQRTNSLVAPGEYDGRLAATKEIASRAGAPMLVAEFELYGAGGGGGGRVSMFLLDGGFGERWEMFLGAVAPPEVLARYRGEKEFDADPNLWVGARVRLTVAHEQIKGKATATVAGLARRTSDHPLDLDTTVPF